MKKKLIFICIFFLHIFIAKTQIKNEITILYLLPFHLNEGAVSTLSIKNSAEIHQIKQFEMMGFWLGTKMALQEYEYANKKINVIIRDVGTDKMVLNKILEDTLLMQDVNMIIGPFYGSLFPTAAEYAKNHCIHIVNPFSTRYDFVENNPYVYKLIPPFISRPEIVDKQFISHSENYNIILWGDSATTPELLAYRYYLTEHQIPYKEVHTLTLPILHAKHNLIVALFDQPERVIHAVHTLVNTEEQQDFTLIVPEKWLSISELTEEFYNLPDLYFFTDCFVDENSDRVKQFKFDYTFFYEAPPELADYSFQGYDITRYFIDLFFEDFNHKNVQFIPLSYQFYWTQILNGGFENVKTRFIQVKNLELNEVISD